MDPSQHEQVLVDAEIQHRGLILSLTGVRGALLLRDEQTRYEKRVVDKCATQYTAHFQAFSRVVRRVLEKSLSQLVRKEDGADGLSALEVSSWFEG